MLPCGVDRVGGRAVTDHAASTSQMGRFETEGDDLDSRPVTEATHPS